MCEFLYRRTGMVFTESKRYYVERRVVERMKATAAGSFVDYFARLRSDAGGEIDSGDVLPGDLVFFETVSKGASHVGIALGGGEFVHAPSSRGVVRVERYTQGYWADRWVGARRVF